MFAGEGPELASWLAAAGRCWTRYFTLEDPRRLEPAERELYVETLLDSKLLLRGFVDRIDVAPDGRIRVVDYKTGSAPGEGFEAKALFQMRFYALVIWRTRGVVPAMLQLIYLGNGEMLRYEPDEADLLATERKVEAIWQAIRREESGDWRPNRAAGARGAPTRPHARSSAARCRPCPSAPGLVELVRPAHPDLSNGPVLARLCSGVRVQPSGLGRFVGGRRVARWWRPGGEH